jgi:hypothetical protein
MPSQRIQLVRRGPPAAKTNARHRRRYDMRWGAVFEWAVDLSMNDNLIPPTNTGVEEA